MPLGRDCRDGAVNVIVAAEINNALGVQRKIKQIIMTATTEIQQAVISVKYNFAVQNFYPIFNSNYIIFPLNVMVLFIIEDFSASTIILLQSSSSVKSLKSVIFIVYFLSVF